MARSLDEVLAALPAKRRAGIEKRAHELATLKDLRQAVACTQEELAVKLGVGQDTISRIERRSDLLLSTVRRYVEAMGGKLDLVARFPNRPAVVINHLAGTSVANKAPANSVRKHTVGKHAPAAAALRAKAVVGSRRATKVQSAR